MGYVVYFFLGLVGNLGYVPFLEAKSNIPVPVGTNPPADFMISEFLNQLGKFRGIGNRARSCFISGERTLLESCNWLEARLPVFTSSSTSLSNLNIRGAWGWGVPVCPGYICSRGMSGFSSNFLVSSRRLESSCVLQKRRGRAVKVKTQPGKPVWNHGHHSKSDKQLWKMIIPPGKDPWLATPISLGLSWSLTNRQRTWEGDRHLLSLRCNTFRDIWSYLSCGHVFKFQMFLLKGNN